MLKRAILIFCLILFFFSLTQKARAALAVDIQVSINGVQIPARAFITKYYDPYDQQYYRLSGLTQFQINGGILDIRKNSYQEDGFAADIGGTDVRKMDFTGSVIQQGSSAGGYFPYTSGSTYNVYVEVYADCSYSLAMCDAGGATYYPNGDYVCGLYASYWNPIYGGWNPASAMSPPDGPCQAGCNYSYCNHNLIYVDSTPVYPSDYYYYIYLFSI